MTRQYWLCSLLPLTSAALIGCLWLLVLPDTGNPATVSTTIVSDGSLPTPTTVTQVGNVYNITGGTRPNDGPNLYHSLGVLNVGVVDIARFLNTTPNLVTSNILTRVTGGNPSNIFGTIDTLSYPGANLFLINPAGITFGPNATLNVGGSVTLTTADYLRFTDGMRFNVLPNDASDMLLSSLPIAAYGFLGSLPGAITILGSQLSVPAQSEISLVGGNIIIEGGIPQSGGPQPARLTAPNGKINLASIASPGEISRVDLIPVSNVNGEFPFATAAIRLVNGSTVDVTGTGRISIRDGEFVLDMHEALLATATGGLSSGTDNIILKSGSKIDTRSDSMSPGGEVQISATNIELDGAAVQSSAFGNGPGGAISIEAQTLTMSNGASIRSNAPSLGAGGPITLNVSRVQVNGASIDSIVSPFDFVADETHGPAITLNVQDLTIRNGGSIDTASIDIFGQEFPIVSGTIAINASNTVMLSGVSSSGQRSSIATGTEGGALGDIRVNGKAVVVTQGARIDSNGEGALSGSAGQIIVTGTESVTVSNGGKIRMNTSDFGGGLIEVSAPNILLDQGILQTITAGVGDAGTINLRGENIDILGGQINTQTQQFLGRGGDVTINATKTLTIKGQFAGTSTDPAGPGGVSTTTDLFGGDAGIISISAPATEISARAQISTSTFGTGNASPITIKTNTLKLSDGGRITAQSTGAGNAGTITVQGLASPAQSVLIDGPGSGIFTDTQGTGAGGDILIKTSQSTTLTNRAAVSASSTGTMDNAGDAGMVTIHAGNTFFMQNGSVTTQATKSGGGQIEINASNLFRLVNNSKVSSSVLNGTGGGGNITIDPNVVVLQNSQILARAIQGAGGNITITTPLFLADQTSLVSASSQFGLNGTVTIQSPTSNLSGSLGTLTSKPSQTQSLLTQRCAAMANGQASSFVVAGREQLPADPGGWLTSPLALAGLDADPPREGTVAYNTPAAMASHDTDRVSLRRLTPAGFLIANFADSEATGCHS